MAEKKKRQVNKITKCNIILKKTEIKNNKSKIVNDNLIFKNQKKNNLISGN